MEPTDIELMLRAQAGDAAAFQQLAQRWREPLRRFFAALLPDRAQADDCVQETLLRLWLHRTRYLPSGKFSTYLFQFARHYALNQRKRYRAAPIMERTERTDETLVVHAPPSMQPESVLLERVRSERIRRAIAALPDRVRVVFEMSHFEAFKYTEIGCRLGIPVGTVKSRMAEAVRRLRAALASEEGDETIGI